MKVYHGHSTGIKQDYKAIRLEATSEMLNVKLDL
jgi:hypothetical protein